MKFDVLYNFISPVTGRILSDPDYVLVGDLLGVAMPSPILIDMRLDIIALRRDLNVVTDASFIIGFPNTELSNAQVLNSLADGYIFNTAGIVSTTPISEVGNVSGPTPPFSTDGNIAVWDGITGRLIKDGLYSIPNLEELAAEAAASASNAASSAASAAGSASDAASSANDADNSAASAANSAAGAFLSGLNADIAAAVAEAASLAAEAASTTAIASAAAAVASATAAAVEAANAANSATDAANSLNTLLTTDLILTGDITASDLLSGPIVTTFAPDPIFSGTGSLTLPSGSTAQRPATPTLGMVRYNTTFSNFEIYNGTSWVLMNSTGVLASLYMSGNATGTIVLASTFTKIAGATTTAFLNNFTSPVDNQLQYTGLDTINALVSANISATHDVLAGSTVGVSIFKNGAQVLPANYAFQLTQNSSTSLVVSVYVQFVTNDYVEVFTSSTTAATVLVTDMSFSVLI